MPPETIPEPGGASHAVGDQGLAPVVPFLDQGIAHGQTMALDGAAPVSPHTHLREARMLLVDIFAHAAGLLLLAHTGRIRMFEASAPALMKRFVEDKVAALTQPRRK